MKQRKINVQGTEIILLQQKGEDYICITNIAKRKNPNDANDVVKNWMRNRSTIEFLGLWEKINNPNFKPVEFDGFKNESGSNTFVLSPKRWIESLNAEFIREGLSQDKRLMRLNETDIFQMKSLIGNSSIKKLEKFG